MFAAIQPDWTKANKVCREVAALYGYKANDIVLIFDGPLDDDGNKFRPVWTCWFDAKTGHPNPKKKLAASSMTIGEHERPPLDEIRIRATAACEDLKYFIEEQQDEP